MIVGPVVAGVAVILIVALILGSKYYRKLVQQRKNSVLELLTESSEGNRVSTANSDAPSYLVELQSSNLYKNRDVSLDNADRLPEERVERPGRVYVIRSDHSSKRARAAILARAHGRGGVGPDDQQPPLSPKFYSEP